MDAPWDGLSMAGRRTIIHSMQRTMEVMTIQETANLMYSAALMTYDAKYDPSTEEGALLYQLHDVLIRTFLMTDYKNCEKENYDQVCTVCSVVYEVWCMKCGV